MVNILILLAGMILGRFIIGGLLFAIFGKSLSVPPLEMRKTCTGAGIVIGGIIATIIIFCNC